MHCLVAFADDCSHHKKKMCMRGDRVKKFDPETWTAQSLIKSVAATMITYCIPE